MQHNMKAVRTKSGWAVSENQPYYLYEAKTKRACLEWIDEAVRIRSELAEHQRQRAERIAAAGWTPIALADIQAGTEYAHLKPNGELSAVRPVARIELLGSGAAMIYHTVEPSGDPDSFTLATGAYQAYTRPSR